MEKFDACQKRSARHSPGRRTSERQWEMSVPIDVPGELLFFLGGLEILNFPYIAELLELLLPRYLWNFPAFSKMQTLELEP